MRRYWQTHDWEFHLASRGGFTGAAHGATFRFRDPPPPAVRARWPGDGVALPDPLPLDYELGELMAERRSRRELKGCSEAHLATVLDLFRIRERLPEGPYEALRRAFPSGGGMHEVEAYAVVWACGALSRGIWHYHAEDGLLYRVCGGGPEYLALLDGARQSAGAAQRPAVLLVLTSRLARMAWKYEGMALKVSILNCGVILGYTSLVAQALDLHFTPLGSGDGELWSRATALDPLDEPSMAECAIW